jgi:hypothetical protein
MILVSLSSISHGDDDSRLRGRFEDIAKDSRPAVCPEKGKCRKSGLSAVLDRTSLFVVGSTMQSRLTNKTSPILFTTPPGCCTQPCHLLVLRARARLTWDQHRHRSKANKLGQRRHGQSTRTRYRRFQSEAIMGVCGTE